MLYCVRFVNYSIVSIENCLTTFDHIRNKQQFDHVLNKSQFNVHVTCSNRRGVNIHKTMGMVTNDISDHTLVCDSQNTF